LSARSNSLLDRFFRLSERGTTPKTEFLAGLTSFVTAAYLIVVIPSTLAAAGINIGAVTTTTICVFVLSTLAMALYARLPFVVGPGLGGAALVASTLAQAEGIRWETGLGIAFWSGILFLVLTLAGLREVVTRVVPVEIKVALSASLGLFITTLGFRNAGLVVVNARSNAYMLGNFGAHGALVALIGLAVVIALHIRRVPGAILISMMAATVAGIFLGVAKVPVHFFAVPGSIVPVIGKLDILGALRPEYLPYLFAFFAAEFFSTMGTTLAVGAEAGLLDANGNMPQINGPFVVDSVAATIGPLIGVPSATALIESAAGVEAGGRTGLSSIFAAGFCLTMLVMSPLILMIPREATAPALILVGLSMFSNLRKIDLQKFTESFPALMAVLMTLYANNFGTGIAAGILTYVLTQVLAGRARKVSMTLYLLTIPLLYFFWTVARKH
jgi:AGZA family xanthine/uracil permease-like MFS transporter